MSAPARSEFERQLDALIDQVEAWSYGESDAGAGVPVELARALQQLSRQAPSPGLRRSLARAQDALDDGLSAEALAAELYQIRSALRAGRG